MIERLSLPISHVFKAIENEEPDRVGCYRLCALITELKTIIYSLLEVEGARAPEPHTPIGPSWRSVDWSDKYAAAAAVISRPAPVDTLRRKQSASEPFIMTL